ncbi:hypothetical protein LL253_07115 [Sphingobium soli]|uniref:Polysaccharide pyruvyl transferase domain-containing protein n=1 Tax=Sphingobium soli TaxID=1591116 RepID=A0ABS8H5R9_9SPHN|nr:hypothetical protein [Sphingobium soli]MCC4232458.1 hypothetical protein [Sphingobium soli]
MKVILHIGDAKCGSSAIQASLSVAANDLLDQGILYHAPNPTNGHSCYTTLFAGKTRGDNEQQKRLALQNMSEIREIVARRQPEYVIFSGETLFNVAPDAMIAQLTEAVGQRLSELHVLAYLRHPVPLYLSNIQQTLKASSRFLPPSSYRRDTPATFVRWRAEPRCTTVTARLFDRSNLVDGSVVPDFEHYLQMVPKIPVPKLSDVQENSSLSTEQTILVQRFRRDFMPDDDGRFMPRSNQLIHFFEKLNNLEGRIGTQAALLPAVQSCIMQRNAPFIAKLNSLFPDLKMTKQYGSMTQNWQPFSKSWTDDVSSILTEPDSRQMALLKSLIPEYDQRLRSGDISSAVANLMSLVKSPRSISVFHNFLKSGGFERAAASVKQI